MAVQVLSDAHPVDAVMGNSLFDGSRARAGVCGDPQAEPQHPYPAITYHGTAWLGHQPP